MRCATCGVEAITAVAPGGRDVVLDFDHVWVREGEPWPTHLFIIGAAPAGAGRLRPYAIPAIELLDRPSSGRAGPFRPEHSCIW